MRKRVEQFIRTRREVQVRKLDLKIEKLTVLINGLDELVHPEEIHRAETERVRAWRKRRNLVSQLPKETTTHVPA